MMLRPLHSRLRPRRSSRKRISNLRSELKLQKNVLGSSKEIVFSAFKEGIYSFLYSTWLEHLEIDFSSLGSRYLDQVTEWNVNPLILEEEFRAWANQDASSVALNNASTPPQDPLIEDLNT